MSLVDPKMVAFMMSKPPMSAAPARLADWLQRKAELYERLADETRDQVEASRSREIAWNARRDAAIQRRIAAGDGSRGLRPAK
jgi:hypothetical protein